MSRRPKIPFTLLFFSLHSGWRSNHGVGQEMITKTILQLLKVTKKLNSLGEIANTCIQKPFCIKTCPNTTKTRVGFCYLFNPLNTIISLLLRTCYQDYEEVAVIYTDLLLEFLPVKDQDKFGSIFISTHESYLCLHRNEQICLTRLLAAYSSCQQYIYHKTFLYCIIITYPAISCVVNTHPIISC